MRILFMGSPSEVINPLKSIINLCKANPEHTLLGVVSQCARATGRKDPSKILLSKFRKIRRPESLAT